MILFVPVKCVDPIVLGKGGKPCVDPFFFRKSRWERSNPRSENAELLRQHKTEELRATMFHWQHDGVESRRVYQIHGILWEIMKWQWDHLLKK